MFIRSEYIRKNFNLDVKTAPKKPPRLLTLLPSAPLVFTIELNLLFLHGFDSLRSIQLHLQEVLAVSAGLKFEKNGMEEYQK